jgi:hypothetical protein
MEWWGYLVLFLLLIGDGLTALRRLSASPLCGGPFDAHGFVDPLASAAHNASHGPLIHLQFCACPSLAAVAPHLSLHDDDPSATERHRNQRPSGTASRRPLTVVQEKLALLFLFCSTC